MSANKTKSRGGMTAAPKVGTTIAPPAGAHHWTLWRITNKVVKNHETGKTRQQTVPERMRGDPGPDGVVADAWLATEFNPQHILARWGAGRYRVEWYSAKNEKLPGEVFEVLEPKARTRVGGSRVAPQVDDDDVQHAPSQASGFPTDPWSMMQFMQQREDAAAERERIRAEAQRERDRDFFAQLQTQAATNLQTMLQLQARPAGGDSNLAAREMAVAMGEMSLKLEKRVAAALEELGSGGGGDDDDDDTPPGSLEEAGSRIGMKLLGELEQKAPELLEEAIPRIATWLKSKGFASSTDLEDELAALRKRRAKKTGTE